MDSKLRQFHADGLGSVKAITDEKGLPIEVFEYGPFGAAENQEAGNSDAHRYAGEFSDGLTGLQYNRERWYEPASGRFMSSDPFVGLVSKPITLNKYIYANADPVNIVDPSGRMGLVEISAANNIASMLTNIQINIGTDILSAKLDSNSPSATGWTVLGSLAPFAITKLLGSAKIVSKMGARGKVAYAKSAKSSNDEIAAATHIVEEFGVGIYLRGMNTMGADAFLSGIKYEIKSIKGNRGVSSNLKKSLQRGQAERFIVDGRGANLTMEHFNREMGSLTASGKYIPTEVIVVLGNGSVHSGYHFNRGR